VASKILEATITHAVRLGSRSAVKRLATEFVGRIYLIHSDPMYRGPLKIERETPVGAHMVEWVLSLPRVLWELGTHNLAFTEIIFLFLLRISQRGRGLMSIEHTEELHRRLVPYLRVEHPSRGALVGPYGKIPPRLQRLILDVVMVSSDGSRGDVAAARDLINAVDLSAGEYWKGLQRIRAHF